MFDYTYVCVAGTGVAALAAAWALGMNPALWKGSPRSAAPGLRLLWGKQYSAVEAESPSP